jgi:hypothetical protein
VGDPGADTTTEPASVVGHSVRDRARNRLQLKRDFGSHLSAYVVVNAGLVVVWACTGHGYLWPGWVLGGWGVLLVLHARDTFWRRPISEHEINEEIERRRHDAGGR